MDFIAYIILGFCFLVFLYFGYRDDSQRDRKKFVTTILGVLMIGGLHVILFQIELEIRFGFHNPF